MNQEEYSSIQGKVATWAEALGREGWISGEDLAQFREADDCSPGALFDGSIHRPLVVGFFGGTGVGKSSLLNRLAGDSIARVGVERPTSREVSLYAHESIQFDCFPGDLPVDRVTVAHHRNERLRQLVWVDMPDIDSAETANRELVLSWLPHIDLLIYVVSPERYRDDCGWRMLMDERGTHAWAFVMNQWDHGHPVQLQDFTALLYDSGFAEPYLFRTQCAEHGGATALDDDFEALAKLIEELADKHLVDQIDSRAFEYRCRRLQARLSILAGRLDRGNDWGELQTRWSSQWETVRNDIRAGLAWVTERAATDFLEGRLKSLGSPSAPANLESAHINAVWDPWAHQRWEDMLTALAVEADARQLPRQPLARALTPLARSAGDVIGKRVEERLRGALARPGNRIQRILCRLSWILSLILPLAAGGWVTFNVVAFYYRSSAEHLGYLGVDFAVHSVLLIGLAWLLPFLLYRALNPSTERSALRGIRAGLEFGLDELGTGISSVLDQVIQRQHQLWMDCGRLLEACEKAHSGTVLADSRVSRLLAKN